VALRGPLGAGKTAFVRAAVRALHGSDELVTSPTFVFRQRYPGRPPVEHVDLYRIGRDEELDEIAFDEAFDPQAVVFVEWPERAESRLPASRFEVAIAGAGDGPRIVRVGRLPSR